MIIAMRYNEAKKSENTSKKLDQLECRYLQFDQHFLIFCEKNLSKTISESLDGKVIKTAENINRDQLYLLEKKNNAFQHDHPDIRVIADFDHHAVIMPTEKQREDIDPNSYNYRVKQPIFNGQPIKDNNIPGLPCTNIQENLEQDPEIKKWVNQVSKDRISEDINHLASFHNRYASGENYKAAAEHCEKLLKGMGYTAELEEFEYCRENKEDNSSKKHTSFNVIANKKGELLDGEKKILVIAHLDSISRHADPEAEGAAPGADDNASGSAGLLEIARIFQGHSLSRRLEFILTGAEEHGLRGSLDYVNKDLKKAKNQIDCVIVMDMIAMKTEKKDTVLLEGGKISSDMIKQMAQLSHTYTNLECYATHDYFNSDHEPFLNNGIPAVLTIEGYYLDVWGRITDNDKDVVANINVGLAAEIVKLNTAYIASKLKNKIREIRLLPPFAIARLGNADEVMSNYDVRINKNPKQVHREILRKNSLDINSNGEPNIKYAGIPGPVPGDFRKGNKIKPVAPFFEIWAIFEHEPQLLQPLTRAKLDKMGLKQEDITWKIELANRKFERTNDNSDTVVSGSAVIKGDDFNPHVIEGKSPAFNRDFCLPLGILQLVNWDIKHRPDEPLMARYIPAKGKVYLTRAHDDVSKGSNIGMIGVSDAFTVDKCDVLPIPSPENPCDNDNLVGALFDENVVLDDSCDGVVSVSLATPGHPLEASARVSSSPPDFCPDSLPIRSLYDELEQLLKGSQVDASDFPLDGGTGVDEKALLDSIIEIIQATVDGLAVTNPMYSLRAIDERIGRFAKYSEEYEDELTTKFNYANLLDVHINRLLKPLRQAREKLDSKSKQSIYGILNYINNRIRTSTYPTEDNLLQMPALMRGGDRLLMMLTKRQQEKLKFAEAHFKQYQLCKTAEELCEKPKQQESPKTATPAADEDCPSPQNLQIAADDVLAQLAYIPKYSPYSTSIKTALGNCFPGLEMDVRGLWSRLLRPAGEDQGTDQDYRLHEFHSKFLFAPDEELVDEEFLLKPTSLYGGKTLFLDNMMWGAVNDCCQYKGMLTDKTEEKAMERSDHLADLDVSKPQDKGYRIDMKHKSVDVALNQLIDPKTGYITRPLPGELTQSLCSPWQYDYKYCRCIYWAASRPDVVNVNKEQTEGKHWPSDDLASYLNKSHKDVKKVEKEDECKKAKEKCREEKDENQTKDFVRNLDGDCSYSVEELYEDWQAKLKHVIKGKDH